MGRGMSDAVVLRTFRTDVDAAIYAGAVRRASGTVLGIVHAPVAGEYTNLPWRVFAAFLEEADMERAMSEFRERRDSMTRG